MSIGVVSELEPVRAPRRRGADKIVVFAAKLAVTGACFWYVAQQVETGQLSSALASLDVRWSVLAVILVMLQIPLVALRWRDVLQVLVGRNERMTSAAIIRITAIGVFFAQVLPSVTGDAVRAWLVVRLGCDWRNAVTSVVIDRAVGVGLLIALGFLILLLPSGLSALGGQRQLVLALYGSLLLAGLVGLMLVPWMAPLCARWRYSRWFATLALDARRVVLGPKGPMILGLGCLVHALTIAIVWSLGRAQGLLLPLPDAAVLFTVMVGVALVPITISGWGLRELAVTSLLGQHGVAPEHALVFSVCFGLALAIGSLPGALAWLLYPLARTPRLGPRGP